MTLEANPCLAQFGCGLSAPTQWLNFDSSPLLRLQKLPVVGALVPAGPFGRFPHNVRYGDIVRGLPLAKNSVEYLYCSHVLEHLSLSEFRQAIRNCYRCLKPGGIFRLVVPDLEFMARQYVNSSDPEAALAFMRETYLGREERPRHLLAFLRSWLGGSQHLWLWDYKALSNELGQVGFVNIRRAILADSGIPSFTQVEDPQRWENALGIQCQK